MKYINTYNTQTEYSSDTTRLYPNVSYVKATQEVQWNRIDPTLMFATFTTTSADQRVRITYLQQLFSDIIIEGAPQPVMSGVLNYTFTTAGEHEVIFRLVNPSSNNQAFRECTTLTSINIPKSVTEIDADAFNGCSGLTSVVIPDSVTSIGNSAFRGCTNMTSVVIPNSVTEIYSAAFYGCGLTEVTIPASLTNWGYGLFNTCTSLRRVVIEDGQTTIGESAFNNCTSLTDIAIPETVTTISDTAIQGCTSLIDISIPASVTSIGKHVFYNDTALSVVRCSPITPPTLGDERVFQYGEYGQWQNINCTIYVPASSVNTYKAATNWTVYANQIDSLQ